MVRKYRFYLRNKTVRYSSLVAFILIIFSSFDVYAHGLNVRYELPIPLSFYLFTSGVVVMITIFLVSYFRFYSYIKESKKITEYRYSNFKLNYLNKIPFLFLVFLVIAGLFGSQGPLDNIINVFIWVWVWVGIAYVSIVFGNVWGAISPWSSIYSLFIFLLRKKLKQIRRHSDKEAEILGLILLFIVLWIAIIFPGREVPYNLSLFLMFYSLITLLGMLVYGRSRWNNSAEIFNIYFGMLGRLGILGRDKKGFKDNLRLPLSGVYMGRGSIYSSLFIVVAVSSISFDGIIETEALDNFKVYIV